MARPVLITTPIYYVNDVPHVGHAYTTIAGDILARSYRLDGRPVFYLTGTDEHGTKIEEAAKARGISSQAFTDEVSAAFVRAWQALEIDYQFFIRTTSDQHTAGVRKFLDALYAARDSQGGEAIYPGFYEGLYCVGCEKFLTEKELVDGRCPDHRTIPEKLKEKNYFFKLSSYLPTVEAAIRDGSLRILPEEKKNEVLGLIGQGLTDFSLSRERVRWGIPLTFDSTQVAYVWVDALANYITGTGYGTDDAKFATWWQDAEVIQLMGKEILKFHCLWWPAMLAAAGLKLPDQMFLHGWFLVDGEKMSKSLGNVIDPHQMVAQYGSDASRYLLMTQFPFGIDGDLQAKRFSTQYNSDLANDLGNLISRVYALLPQVGGTIPPLSLSSPAITILQNQQAETVREYRTLLADFKLHAAIGTVMTLVRATNKFFNDAEPWKLSKAGKQSELESTLRACLESIRTISILLLPTMPSKMTRVIQSLGMDAQTVRYDDAASASSLRQGNQIAKLEGLFPRMEKSEKPEAAAPVAASAQSFNEDGLISIDQFKSVQLRIATVTAAEPVAGANKLLKLQLDVGGEPRQIVSGIADFYRPDVLVGKQIVLVANLKPAVIRGVESHGMLLAAKKGGQLVIVGPDGPIPSGADVS